MRKYFKPVSLLVGVLITCSMLLGFFVMSTPVSASTGDFFSSKITVTQGQISSGNAASLSSKDGSYLTIKSINSSGYNYVDWITEFTLPSSRVSSLSLSYSGKYSTWRSQYIYLYNYSTSNWYRIDYRTIGAAIVNINLSSIANPTNFVSSTGKMQVRLYSMSSASFSAYTDLLKLRVAY